ncbi:MAG TPA: hypothetical protein VN625_05530, partial [Desulfuromonadaceae bacterium]|nr:hypothetical protein [Desulfuromonadaceae bacterium]
GLTIAEPLQNAPPMLAFTTVALGGFRGLISNFLWIRANDLQQDDKFFEAAQLASWITDLEPHFSQVWAYQGWNMAYNISVKFKDFSDRWRWVNNGIELLRDNALRYNPDDVLIYRELSWFFQHKMGQNLDDANLYYKEQWAIAMSGFFGLDGTNIVDLLEPGNTNAIVLREKYKLDPAFIKKVNDQYGPLDWRLPESHAIYWAMMGLAKADEHPDKIKKDDPMMLRREVFQSMQEAFRHGRIISNPFNEGAELAPNLDIIPKVNDAYLQMMAESSAGDSNHVANAGYKNFLRDAVYFLWENNRLPEARKWFKYLGERYSDRPILENDPTSLPKNLTLDDYAFARVQQDVGETSQERITAVIQGMILLGYLDLVIGQNNRAAGYQMKAQLIYDRYQQKWAKDMERLQLPPMDKLKREVLNDMLDPKNDRIPFAGRAVLRTQLGLPAETTNSVAPFAMSTNMAPPTASNTNGVKQTH